MTSQSINASAGSASLAAPRIRYYWLLSIRSGNEQRHWPWAHLELSTEISRTIAFRLESLVPFLPSTIALPDLEAVSRSSFRRRRFGSVLEITTINSRLLFNDRCSILGAQLSNEKNDLILYISEGLLASIFCRRTFGIPIRYRRSRTVHPLMVTLRSVNVSPSGTKQPNLLTSSSI